MTYLRMPKRGKQKKEQPTPSSWVTNPTPTSLAARLTPEQKDLAVIAELRYLEEQLAWRRSKE